MSRKPKAPSPFNWQGEPSVLAADKAFKLTKAGKTQSQTATEVVDAFREKNGKCRGTLTGISRADRILANRWGSPYLKPRSGAQ